MFKNILSKDNLITIGLVVAGVVIAMLWVAPWVAGLISKAKAKSAA